jgi:hypothetical protein
LLEAAKNGRPASSRSASQLTHPGFHACKVARSELRSAASLLFAGFCVPLRFLPAQLPLGILFSPFFNSQLLGIVSLG